MNRLDAVVKVGGSLLHGTDLHPLLEVLREVAAAGNRLLLVPGGGPMADTVREVCRAHQPGESAAHWMGILAMDQHAQLVAGRLPEARLVTGQPEEIATAPMLAILAPYAWLLRDDPLPHSWAVTGDSIAAWVAARLGARLLVLLKSIDGLTDGDGALVAGAGRERLADTPEVDGYFARLPLPAGGCWLVNGRHPERLRELLLNGSTYGTRIG